MDEKLKAYLKEHGISYKVHEHPAVFTVEESKHLKKEIPAMHCKTLFLKEEGSKFYLVGMKAEKRLDTKKLKEHLKIKKLNFASPQELKEEVNLIPGSVSIFGAIYIKDKRVKLIVDEDVWNAPSTGFHPNINTSTLEISHENLVKYINSLKCEKEILLL